MAGDFGLITFDGVPYTIFNDDINATINGNNTLLAAAGAGLIIRVINMSFVCGAEMTVGLSSDANVKMAGAPLAKNGGPVWMVEKGWVVQTNANEELRMVTNDVGPVVGFYNYILVRL